MLECIGQRKERNVLHSKGIAPLARDIASEGTFVVVERFGKGVVAEDIVTEDIVTKITAVAAQGVLHPERVVETVEAPRRDLVAQCVESEQASRRISFANAAVSLWSRAYWYWNRGYLRPPRVDQRVKPKSREASRCALTHFAPTVIWASSS